MHINRLTPLTVVLAAMLLVIGVSSGAVAAKLITGKDVKDGSLTSADVKNGTLTTSDIKKAGVGADRLKKASINTDRLKNGAVGPDKLKANAVDSSKIKDGSIGPNDLSKTAFGPNWGIVDRNVIGNGDSFLRAGPTSAFANQGAQRQTPPLGIGSLGVRTGSGADKVAFGNQVDYQGQDFSSITAVDYWAFTTGENITGGGGAVNLPSVEFEINPNLAAHPADVFSTAVFIPPASANLPGWNDIDAVTTGEWFLTGQTGTDVGCNQVTTCTFAQLVTNLDDADATPPTIFTVEISKGRDFAYSGAVDALTINTDVFDFEPFGVIHTTAPAAKHR